MLEDRVANELSEVQKLKRRVSSLIMGIKKEMQMWFKTISLTIFILMSAAIARAASYNDEIFANAALRELHRIAIASYHSKIAAKDSDKIGCEEGYVSAHSAAHEALTNMHQMSFEPIDALSSLSAFLRVSDLSNGGCPTNDFETMLAGQTIIKLRTDYSIGEDDWYTIKADGTIESKSPLIYAKSLIDQNYSWVDVRPKGLRMIVVSDWNAEMASNNVADSNLANDGKKIDAVEVGYRKNDGDENTEIYFYQTREGAVAVADNAKQKLVDDAKEEADRKALTTEWRQKLLSLPYMVENHDTGFKLVYSVCVDIGKNADGSHNCKEEGSHDWSDNKALPYRWYESFKGCDDAISDPPSVTPAINNSKTNPTFYCLPAPKPIKQILKGYKVVFSLTAPNGYTDDNSYAEIKDLDKQTATIFKTFDACYDAIDAPHKRALADLGTDTDGYLLSDKSKAIGLIATCSRVY